MASTISAGTTSGTAIVVSGDTTGNLELKTQAGANTITVPNSTGNMVLDSATQTLTNKSIAATQLTGTIAVARLPAGSVLQVVSATINSENSTSSTSFVSTGLSVSITPTSSNSKVLVLVNGCSFGVSGTAEGYWTVDRAGTNIGNGNGGFGRTWNAGVANFTFTPAAISYLDSPATTSSITYTVQFRQTNAAQFVYISGGNGRSSITLMEIAA